MIAAASRFRWIYLFLILGLSLCNYGFRFLKWQYYLRTLGITIPRQDSLIIYLGGLALTISPSKLGEVIKSRYLKLGFQEPVAKTAPIVIADRLTDLLAVIVLTLLGASTLSLPSNVRVAIIVCLVFALLLLLLLPYGKTIIALLGRLSFLERFTPSLLKGFESSQKLLSLSKLILPLLLSLLAWACEAIGLYLTLYSFGTLLSPLAAIFVYSAATLFGVLTFLPGGIGSTEATMVGLLTLLGVSSSISVPATVIIRFCTLWFAVILGYFFLLSAEKRYNRPDKERD